MTKINNLTTFEKFLLAPQSLAVNKGGKCGLLALSILFGIVTLGIAHGVAALINRVSKGEREDNGKIKRTASDVFPQNSQENVSLDNTKSSEKELLSIKSEPPNEKSFETVSKYFKTVENLAAADVGNYQFEEIKGTPYQKLKIKDVKEDREVIVRESTTFPKRYRLVIRDNQGVHESYLPLTAPQISSMLRWAKNPPRGFHVSELTKVINSKTGLIVFTEERSNKRYIVDSKGLMSEITDLNAFLNYAKTLQ